MTYRRSAFTLLELLTVIAILGLLLGILLPSLSSARDSAKANACLSHIKMIGTSFSLYLNENEDKYPPVRIESASPGSSEFYVNDDGRAAPRWQWFLNMDMGPLIAPKPFQPAIDSAGYFFDDTPSRQGASSMDMSHDAFTCASLKDPAIARHVRDGAYGYNYQYLGNSRQDTIPGRWDNFPVPRHRIRSPAATVVIADSRGTGPRHGQHSYTLDPPRLATENKATRFGPEPSSSDLISDDDDYVSGTNDLLFRYSPAEARHQDLANVLFADSHAEAKSLEELGYELEPEGAGIPPNTPRPVRDSAAGPYKASNKLWNGQGFDRVAQDANGVP